MDCMWEWFQSSQLTAGKKTNGCIYVVFNYSFKQFWLFDTNHTVSTFHELFNCYSFIQALICSLLSSFPQPVLCHVIMHEVMKHVNPPPVPLSLQVNQTAAPPRPCPPWHPVDRIPGRLRHLLGTLTAPGPPKDQITTDPISVKGTLTRSLCCGERCLSSK